MSLAIGADNHALFLPVTNRRARTKGTSLGRVAGGRRWARRSLLSSGSSSSGTMWTASVRLIMNAAPLTNVISVAFGVISKSVRTPLHAFQHHIRRSVSLVNTVNGGHVPIIFQSPNSTVNI